MKYYEWFEMKQKELAGDKELLEKFYLAHDVITWTYGSYDDKSMIEDVTALFNDDHYPVAMQCVKSMEVKSYMVQEFFNDYRLELL